MPSSDRIGVELEELAARLDELLQTAARMTSTPGASAADRPAARRLKRYFQGQDRLPEMTMRRADVSTAVNAALQLLQAGRRKGHPEIAELQHDVVDRLRETSAWLREVARRLQRSTLPRELEAVINVLETNAVDALRAYEFESVSWMNVAVINRLAEASGLPHVFEVRYPPDGGRTLTVLDPEGGPAVAFRISPVPLQEVGDISQRKIDRAIALLLRWHERIPRDRPPEDSRTTARPGYASVTDTVPDRYCNQGRPNGPLTGNQRQLAWAVDPVPKREPRGRILRRLHGGRVFVQQESGRKYHVCFLSMKAFHEAEERLAEIGDDPDCWKSDRPSA